MNFAEVFTDDDYPMAALARNEQGKVVVTLTVDSTGAVAACRIDKSSGSSSLDEQTCALFRTRAIFEPGKDSRGHPKTAQYQRAVTWVITEPPRAPPLPRQAWQYRTQIAFDADDQVLTCTTTRTGLEMDPPDCGLIMAAVKKAQVPLTAGTLPASWAINQVNFYPLDPAQSPILPKIPNAIEVAQEVARITVATDGRIARCEPVSKSGMIDPGEDICNDKQTHFVPAASDAGELVGTLILTVYRRPENDLKTPKLSR